MIHRKFQESVFDRSLVKRPSSFQTTISLTSDSRQRVDPNRKHYFKVHLVNNTNKDTEKFSELLKYYSNQLRLSPNLREIHISQLILTDRNLKLLITWVRSLKMLEKVVLDIKLSDRLSSSLVKSFYSSLARLPKMKDTRIFTSTFYRYPPNLLLPLFSRKNLQSQLKGLELTLTRELHDKKKGIFFQNLKHFKNVNDLSLDFSRASTVNMLPCIFNQFQTLSFLNSLSLNLNGQYVTREAYQNLAQSLSALNITKLFLIFKCSSTIGEDLSMVLKTCQRLLYLKLAFLDESKLTMESLAPLEGAVRGLYRLQEFYLDVSQTVYCNFILRKVALGFNKAQSMQRLWLKFNSLEDFSTVKGITMMNIRDILLAHPNLKVVDLQCSNSQGIKDRIGFLLQGIKELKELESFSLFLHYCPLSDYSFGGLLRELGKKKRLKNLSLAVDSYRLTNNSLYELRESLQGLKLLEYVQINMIKWKVTEEGLQNLSSWILNCGKLLKVEVIFQETCVERTVQEFGVEISKNLPKHRVKVEYRR